MTSGTFDPRTEYQDVEVAERYDRQRFSSLSGRVFQWAERRAFDRILRVLPPHTSVLDAPCGTGRLMPLFLGRGWRAVGADISGEMLAVARRRASQWNSLASFCRADFLQIPLTDRSVTATFSIRFLVHIPPEERVAMLREFRRVTKHWVVISVALSTPWHRLRRRIKVWLGHPKPVRYPVTNHALVEELHRAGLQEVARFWTFPLLSEQLIVISEPTHDPARSRRGCGDRWSAPTATSGADREQKEHAAMTQSAWSLTWRWKLLISSVAVLVGAGPGVSVPTR